MIEYYTGGFVSQNREIAEIYLYACLLFVIPREVRLSPGAVSVSLLPLIEQS